MGPGNTRVVEMDIKGGIASDLEYMRIGGTPNDVWSNLSSFRYRINGGSEQYFMIKNPNIAMINMTGLVEFSEGLNIIEIRILDELSEGVDLDGDGALYSWVVEIGLVY